MVPPFRAAHLFQTIHDVSLMLDRERVGRDASLSGGVLDSQTVKAPHAKARGQRFEPVPSDRPDTRNV